MYRETCRVNEIRTVTNNVALKVDFNQRRCRHFVEQDAVRVDQKPFLHFPIFIGLIGQFGRNMSEHQIRPAIERAQPIQSGQFNT